MSLHSHSQVLLQLQAVPQYLLHHVPLSHARDVRCRSLDLERFVIGILRRFRLVSRGAFGNSVLVLQAR